MPLLNSGRDLLAALLVGEGTPLDNANIRLVVGNGTTTFSATQTDLAGVNKVSKSVIAGSPTRTDNTITVRADFATNEANFAWNEWGLANTGGIMFNRKVVSMGTKESSQAWQLTVTVTLVAA